MERWEAAAIDNFPNLEQLILDGLYKLDEIQESIGNIITLQFIGIKWCSHALEKSAKKIQQGQQSF